MLHIYHQFTDLYFNVATDEYILKQIEEDCFRLWCNDNAIVVDQYQNTMAQINYDYVKEHQISGARWLSGGEALYHEGKDTNLSDFEKFICPVEEVLQSLDADARFEDKNDKMIYGKKNRLLYEKCTCLHSAIFCWYFICTK